MKKLLLSLFVLLGLTLGTSAQILELFHDGEPFVNGGSITIDGDPSQAELETHISVKNISSSDVIVKCRKIELAVIGGTANYFCWGACYSPSVYLSPLTVTIAPDVMTDEFSGHYSPSGIAGIQEMCYSFFDINNPNDSVYYYVNFFASGLGINEVNNNPVFVSNPYPNPANSQVSFDYTLPSNASKALISVHNLLGAKVKEINLAGEVGKVVVDVNDLNDGIYFYSVSINNSVIETKRLVISR